MPPPPLIKICGITSAKDAQCAQHNGANLIGLIFAENSKRKVSLLDAVEIRSCLATTTTTTGPTINCSLAPLPPLLDSPSQLNHLWYNAKWLLNESTRRPLLVGVFQNQRVEFINEVAKSVPLDLIQLHGNEHAITNESFIRPTIKSIGVTVHDTPSTLRVRVEQLGNRFNFILFDTQQIQSPSTLGLYFHASNCIESAEKAQNGGCGIAFNWNVLESIADLPLIVAGGLNCANVKSLEYLKPFCVDVASGVEMAGTKRSKDYLKIEKFCLEVKKMM